MGEQVATQARRQGTPWTAVVHGKALGTVGDDEDRRMRAAHDSHAPCSAVLERADAYEPISVFVLDVVHRIVPLVAKDNAPRIRSTFRAAQRLAIGLHPGRQHLLAGFNAQAEERMAHLAARLPSA